MSWLLKIVEGPMSGAEVALVDGTRVKVGTSDDCDIIVSDASLQDFTLDVSEGAVTLLTESGEARVLKAFEIASFGQTAVAVGPAEGAWQPLVRPEPTPPTSDAVPETEAGAPAPSELDSETPVEGEPWQEAESSSKKEEKTSRRWGWGCLVACLILLLVLLLAFLAWYYWPQVRERCPSIAERAEGFVSKVRNWVGSNKGDKPLTPPVQAPAQATSLALEEIARQHGLELLRKNDRPLLRGNVRLRTERLAIRALALSEDVHTEFDLTDDETLKASADELLFVVTEGALKAVSASNRVVALSGYAPSAPELERAIRALNADVPGIDRLETSAIQVGGTPPKAVAKTKFAAAAVKAAAAPTVAPAAKRDYPIAGIITKPYPLVVMRNGLRLAEGAQVGTAVIERIEEDKLVLRDGKSTFEWKP